MFWGGFQNRNRIVEHNLEERKEISKTVSLNDIKNLNRLLVKYRSIFEEGANLSLPYFFIF